MVKFSPRGEERSHLVKRNKVAGTGERARNLSINTDQIEGAVSRVRLAIATARNQGGAAEPAVIGNLREERRGAGCDNPYEIICD